MLCILFLSLYTGTITDSFSLLFSTVLHLFPHISTMVWLLFMIYTEILLVLISTFIVALFFCSIVNLLFYSIIYIYDLFQDWICPLISYWVFLSKEWVLDLYIKLERRTEQFVLFPTCYMLRSAYSIKGTHLERLMKDVWLSRWMLLKQGI